MSSRVIPLPTAPKTPINSTHRPCLDRRVFLSSFLAAQAAVLAPSDAHASELTPYQQGFRLEYGLNDGRIRRCNAAAQPNCVSTASTNGDLYSPPWLAGPSLSVENAMEEFDSALRALSPAAELLETSSTSNNGIYRRYKVPSSFEYDIVEIMIAPSSPPYDSEPPLVTFRSQAGTVKYIWPITQPISDMGAQKKRMSEIRRRLEWRISGGGCDLIECYQD